MTDQGLITLLILGGVSLGWVLGYIQGTFDDRKKDR